MKAVKFMLVLAVMLSAFTFGAQAQNKKKVFSSEGSVDMYTATLISSGKYPTVFTLTHFWAVACNAQTNIAANNKALFITICIVLVK